MGEGEREMNEETETGGVARQWTEAERELTDASRVYFEKIAACIAGGGDVQAAIVEAMPPELRAAPGMDMMAALGSI